MPVTAARGARRGMPISSDCDSLPFQISADATESSLQSIPARFGYYITRTSGNFHPGGTGRSGAPKSARRKGLSRLRLARA